MILEYLGAQAGQLIAPYGSDEYWQQRQWLNFIATELHKNFISPFRKGNWLPNTAESKALVWQRVLPRLRYVEHAFGDGRAWLTGDKFSIADPYLFVMTNWIRRLDYRFEDLPLLEQFDRCMRKRDTVVETFRVEGKPHALLDVDN